jgi:hypothetical protein
MLSPGIFTIIELFLGLLNSVKSGPKVDQLTKLEQIAKAVFDEYQAQSGKPLDMSKLTPAKEIE